VSQGFEVPAGVHLSLPQARFREKFPNFDNILIYLNNKWNVVSSDYLPEGVDKHEN